MVIDDILFSYNGELFGKMCFWYEFNLYKRLLDTDIGDRRIHLQPKTWFKKMIIILKIWNLQLEHRKKLSS